MSDPQPVVVAIDFTPEEVRLALAPLGEMLAMLRRRGDEARDRADDVRACAEWCRDELQRIGLEQVQIVDTPGQPVVYGEWLGAAGAPTILFYGHYDVQPVDPLDLWQTPPFEATIRDGEIYARGAADDKGQLVMHLAAIEAILHVTGELPIGVIVLVEGQEEIDGPAIQSWMSLDTWVFGDTMIITGGGSPASFSRSSRSAVSTAPFDALASMSDSVSRIRSTSAATAAPTAECE